MGKKTKEKKAPRQRSRDVAQTVDAGEEQPNTRRKPPSDRSIKNNKKNNKTRHKHHHQEIDEDSQITKSLAELNLEVLDMNPDGNCLFRALSDQLYGDFGNDHASVRSEICDFMEQNKQDFKDFLVVEDDSNQQEEDARDIDHYIEQMREDGEWGGDIEIMAAARLYNRKIWVYSATLDAYNFANEGSKSVGPDLLVSFHGHDNHYNSVRRKGSPPKKCETNIHSHKNDKEKKKPAKEINDLPPPSERTSVDPPGMRSRNGKSRETAERSGAKMEKILIDDKSIKRNDPCPCGSNLKYKKCCLAKQKLDRRERERTQTKIKDEEEEASDLDAQRIASSFQTVTI